MTWLVQGGLGVPGTYVTAADLGSRRSVSRCWRDGWRPKLILVGIIVAIWLFVARE